MRTIFFIVFGLGLGLLSTFALSGCTPPDCAAACTKLASCGIDAGTLSCDASCDNKFSDRSCAGCVNANSCTEIKQGCGIDCPQLKL
jgi:hypothetical protein